MKRRVAAIAWATFREAVRNRVLFSMVFFAVGLIGFAVLLGSLAIGDVDKIVRDVGLAGIRLIGIAIALFSGITLVVQEVERRTIYTVLSKPLPRWEFVVGKWLGLALLLAAEIGILALAYFAVLWGSRTEAHTVLLVPLVMIYVECLVVVGLALFFSAFTSPVVAAFATTGAWITGQLAGDLRAFAAQAKAPLVQDAGALISRLVPNLDALNFTSEAVHLRHVDPLLAALSAGYGLAWALLLMAAACLLYARKDFDG